MHTDGRGAANTLERPTKLSHNRNCEELSNLSTKVKLLSHTARRLECQWLKTIKIFLLGLCWEEGRICCYSIWFKSQQTFVEEIFYYASISTKCDIFDALYNDLNYDESLLHST